LEHVDAEVIVVDNGSKEYSTKVFNDKIIYLRFCENLGFSRACNMGAKVSSGDIIIFLNNDTIISNDFVTPILNVFAHDDAGIVGSKLFYENGDIQHAGIDFEIRDGNLEGRNIHEDMPFGEVAAVTGACLAIKRDLFFSLNGFDEAYWVGNEDSDLCFRAREAGERVVYQPLSVLTHLESCSGSARWVAVTENVRILTERWANKPEVWML
jgi:GT2 family glycosyltransferase